MQKKWTSAGFLGSVPESFSVVSLVVLVLEQIDEPLRSLFA
jgi:hypothetical protein